MKEFIYRSKSGLLSQSYSGSMRNSRRRGHPKPEYSLNELRDWCYSQYVFHCLHKNWVDSGYNIDLTPSIDRLKDDVHYQFKNIQIVTWKENREKAYSDRRNGIDNRLSKQVIQTDLNGLFIELFYSAREADRRTGVNQASIGKCCNGKAKTAGKFKWKYKN